MFQRVGYFLVFLGLLIGGTVFLIWMIDGPKRATRRGGTVRGPLFPAPQEKGTIICRRT